MPTSPANRHTSWVLAIWTLSVCMWSVPLLHALWDHVGEHHRPSVAQSIEPDRSAEHSHSVSRQAPGLPSSRTNLLPPLLQLLAIEPSVVRLASVDGRNPAPATHPTEPPTVLLI